MRHLIFCLLLAAPAMASASFDISCTDNDCWTSGWVVEDNQTRQTSEIQCVAGSCQDNGWIQRMNGRFLSETVCLEGGCWTDGFDIYNRDGNMVSGFRCEEDPNLGTNCLTAGWTIVDWRERPAGYAECVAGDCERFGWDIHMNDGRLQIIRCKDESCFTNGWTLRP